jgi:hypothetical protein
MGCCDCEQCKLWTALQKDDRSLVDHAFSLLESEGGHYEGYGDTYAGAGACYILRVGSKQDKDRLARLIRKDEVLRSRIVEGLWDEYGLGYKLISKIFELSAPEQRHDILVAVDIRASESFDISKLVGLLLRQELKPWEEVLIRQTLDHRHWA